MELVSRSWVSDDITIRAWQTHGRKATFIAFRFRWRDAFRCPVAMQNCGYG
jgi:hypothetical protein